jgi:hypothetical protein
MPRFAYRTCDCGIFFVTKSETFMGANCSLELSYDRSADPIMHDSCVSFFTNSKAVAAARRSEYGAMSICVCGKMYQCAVFLCSAQLAY